MNPLTELPKLGQSVWLDYIDRHLVQSGALARLMAEDDLRGVTSNPAIFEKAIRTDADYRAELASLRAERLAPAVILERLVLPDIRAAAAQLRVTYAGTGGRDGFVSLEVPPALAFDTDQTIVEARRLWRAVGRENLMIKVPATDAGLPAITQLIAEGINVNATLLFSRSMYERVAQAYISGLEQRVAAGLSVAGAASVASFFVSRIDTEVDDRLAERLNAIQDERQRGRVQRLMGTVAIANAKLAYRSYQGIFSGARWQALAEHGARTQRLLWASTGVKNPAYRDVRYIEDLIGPDTVNTVPPATLEAFRDHGRAHPALTDGVDDAQRIMEQLEGQGIVLDEVTDGLLQDGVRLFVEAYDKLLASLG
ncbi:MAG: transaldolase [Betaproteobacteria bacterium]|nr:transaldolase [Betaproteobacteria bacterium]